MASKPTSIEPIVIVLDTNHPDRTPEVSNPTGCWDDVRIAADFVAGELADRRWVEIRLSPGVVTRTNFAFDCSNAELLRSQIEYCFIHEPRGYLGTFPVIRAEDGRGVILGTPAIANIHDQPFLQ